MSRFKTGIRIEDAIKHRDRRELVWAEEYTHYRLKIAGMKQHEKHWRSVAKRVKEALDALPEKTEPIQPPQTTTGSSAPDRV